MTSTTRREFATSATVLPRIRIEAADESPIRLTPGVSQRRAYRVVSCGTAGEPPLTLADDSLRVDLPMQWEGGPEEHAGPGETIEQSRSLVIEFDGRSDPGPRGSAIHIVQDGEPVLDYPLTWEVSAALVAIPSGLFFTPPDDRPSRAVVLHASEGRAFRIERVECDVEGLSFEWGE